MVYLQLKYIYMRLKNTIWQKGEEKALVEMTVGLLL